MITANQRTKFVDRVEFFMRKVLAKTGACVHLVTIMEIRRTRKPISCINQSAAETAAGEKSEMPGKHQASPAGGIGWK